MFHSYCLCVDLSSLFSHSHYEMGWEDEKKKCFSQNTCKTLDIVLIRCGWWGEREKRVFRVHVLVLDWNVQCFEWHENSWIFRIRKQRPIPFEWRVINAHTHATRREHRLHKCVVWSMWSKCGGVVTACDKFEGLHTIWCMLARKTVRLSWRASERTTEKTARNPTTHNYRSHIKHVGWFGIVVAATTGGNELWLGPLRAHSPVI